MFNLVWLIDPGALFEVHWIKSLLSDLEYNEIISPVTDKCMYNNSLFIFNHSIDYNSVFKRYEQEQIPFAVIHLSDECLSDDFSFYHYPMCKFVFRNYYHPHASTLTKVTTFGLGYKNNFADIQVQTRFTDYYHWCFAGNIHDASRIRALIPFATIQPHKTNTTQDYFNSKNSLSLEEYKTWMVESKFCVCPIGQGNIDTFRVYEALEAGSIPITLSMTKYQQYTPSYWHLLFDETDVPFIHADTMGQCSENMIRLLANAETYYTLKEVVATFWNRIKEKWRKQLCGLIVTHIALGNA